MASSIDHEPPILHVGFLKVHKAGSTTIQNLLFRFAIRHNLTLSLPVTGGGLRKPETAMPLKNGYHYDILANYVLNWSDIFRLLPKDAARIAIIRDPLDRAVSAAYYYKDVFHEQYLLNIQRKRFIENLISFHAENDTRKFRLTKNAMGADFLLSKNKDHMKYNLDRLKSQFHLVMVMEKFEESLLLLKRMLRWSIQDVIFLPTNKHAHAGLNLIDELRQKFREINFIDYAIYEYFVPILEEKIKREGKDFQKELSYFKGVLLKVKRFCHSQKSMLKILASNWNREFQMSNTECELIMAREVSFVMIMRERHKRMQQT